MDPARSTAHLAGVFFKRVMKAALARGWSSWCERYTEQKRQTQLLKKAVGTLMKPALVGVRQLESNRPPASAVFEEARKLPQELNRPPASAGTEPEADK